jgi:hypothetical protein
MFTHAEGPNNLAYMNLRTDGSPAARSRQVVAVHVSYRIERLRGNLRRNREHGWWVFQDVHRFTGAQHPIIGIL